MTSTDHSSPAALQAFLDTHVPLARAAEMQVDACEASHLLLSAPLDKNDNDKGTAFGGSLYNLCVMAGWGMTWYLSREFGYAGDLVVAKGEIEYLRPLKGRLQARVERPETELVAQFQGHYERRGRASIWQQAQVLDDAGHVCVSFRGKYAIVRAS